MHITTYPEAGAFLQRARAYLERHEAVNNLPLGLALRLLTAAAPPAEPPYFAVVEDQGDIAAGAVMIGHNVILFGERAAPAPALELIAEDLRAGGWPVPGVSAPVELAEQFARIWGAASNTLPARSMHMRIYTLTRVEHPPYPSGELLPATAADRTRIHADLTDSHGFL